ncbi:MAG: hypothetical protein ACQCN5_01535 [Candidatus Bathyarchaeia archaeon]|jgi:hypothetical protein
MRETLKTRTQQTKTHLYHKQAQETGKDPANSTIKDFYGNKPLVKGLCCGLDQGKLRKSWNYWFSTC